MHFTTIFFDLDDTLYPPQVGLWRAIKERMNIYMRERLQVPEQEIPILREKYFTTYGTTLRGLQRHHDVDTRDFLAFVHDLPLKEYLVPDANQRAVIAEIPAHKVIFTNADIFHAQRVLSTLHLDDLFDTIVDVNAIAPYCKPMRESFGMAMKLSGVEDPARCVMIDDLPRTTRAAREAGLFSVLYNDTFSAADADAQLTDWNNLKTILENQ